MGTQQPSIYIVSDSIGETAEFVARAAASQFDIGHVHFRRYPGVKDSETLEQIVREAGQDGGLIIFTLVLQSLRERLIELAGSHSVEAVDVMGPMLTAFKHRFGVEPSGLPGVVHQLDADYYRRVEAVEFAVKYDDGRDSRGMERADIMLIGVSRTSKTPLSMYLAHRQLRVANVPLVPEVNPPKILFEAGSRKKTVGLTIQAEKLLAIRKARLETLGLASQANYASEMRILDELAFADEVMKKIGCFVVDVTDKAVEETASEILDYFDHMEGVTR